MSPFLIASGVLCVVAMLFVALPLLRGQRGSLGVDRRSANVALYRERLAELEAQRTDGAIDAAAFDALAAESAAALLEDADTEESHVTAPVSGATKHSWKAVVAIVVSLAAVAIFVYRELGAIDLVNLDRDRALLTDTAQDDDSALARWAERLERHLARRPDDAKVWYLLGHARMRQGNYRAAVTAFETLQALSGGETAVLTSLAQAQFMADEGVVSDKNRALMMRIVALAPHDSVVREILAVDAFRAGRFAEAAVHLESALAGGVTGPRAEAMRSALERVRAAGGGSDVASGAGAGVDAADGPGIDVAVDMSAIQIADHPQGALFVFARRAGERMPLLVARVAALEPVIRLRLDNRHAMQAGVVPASGDALEIVARFSPSGRVGDEPGAREATLGVVWAQTAAAELTFGATSPRGAAAGVASRGDASRGDASRGDASRGVAAGTGAGSADPATAAGVPGPVRLRVALQQGVTPPPGSRVFVILREPGGPPMPIAVRPLDPARLPAQIEMSDADAMQPGRVISQFATVEAVARLSMSGNAMRQPGDVESDAVSVAVGAQTEANLTIGDG